MKQENFETLYNNDIKKEIKRKRKLLRTIIRINKPPIKEKNFQKYTELPTTFLFPHEFKANQVEIVNLSKFVFKTLSSVSLTLTKHG